MLTVCETVKVPITYTEIHEMSYPEFAYTQKHVYDSYKKLLEETNKLNEKAANGKKNKGRG